MSDIKPVEEWGCLPQVTAVIGLSNALRELGRVRDVIEDIHDGAVRDLDSDALVDAFSWYDTPQGGEFWDEIDDGNVPKGLQGPAQGEERVLKVGDKVVLSQELGSVRGLENFAGLCAEVIGLCYDLQGDLVMVVQDPKTNGFRAILARENLYTFVDDSEENLREEVLQKWRDHRVSNRHDQLSDTPTVSDMIDFVLSNYVKSGPEAVGTEIVNYEDLHEGDVLKFVGYSNEVACEHGYQYVVGSNYVVGYDRSGDLGPLDEDSDAPVCLENYNFVRVK